MPQIDWTSFMIGTVVGLTVAFLFKLHTLKRLDLMLKKVGIQLGVEGFEEKNPPSGVSIGDISGTAGDIAGRDIDKSIGKNVDQKIDKMINKNSQFYQTVQQAAKEATKQVLQGAGAEGMEGGNPILQRTIRIESRSSDARLLSTLQSIQGRGDQWFDKYASAYFSSEDFRSGIDQLQRDIAQDGWYISIIRPIDNINNGLLVEVVAQKPMGR
ncbi:hypothetical protein HUU61_24930 [Rhodopseudomonas palustris]|nr:hypothetical protein [Rhodopseudomonas palustris]